MSASAAASAAAAAAGAPTPTSKRSLTDRLSVFVKEYGSSIYHNGSRLGFYASMSARDIDFVALSLTHDQHHIKYLESCGENAFSIENASFKCTEELEYGEGDFCLKTEGGRRALREFRERHASHTGTVFIYDEFQSSCVYIDDDGWGSISDMFNDEHNAHVFYAVWECDKKLCFEAVQIVERESYDGTDHWFDKTERVLEDLDFLGLVQRNLRLVHTIHETFDKARNKIANTLLDCIDAK